MKVALIGAGNFGTNILRNLFLNSGVSSVLVCDISLDRLKSLSGVNRNGKELITTNKIESILLDDDIESVFVATNAAAHFDVIKRCLEHKKNVFSEKPLTLNSKDAEFLVTLARDKNVLLHVDCTYIYSSPIICLKNLIDFDVIGKPLCFKSTRTNLSPNRIVDVDVIQDLAPHCLSIVKYLFPDFRPEFILCYGSRNLSSRIDDAYVHLFNAGFDATFHVSWVLPPKKREIVVGGTLGVYTHDDAKSDSPLINFLDGRVKKFDNFTDLGEALAVEIEHFFECVRWDKTTHSTGLDGLETVKLIELAHKSLELNGAPVKL